MVKFKRFSLRDYPGENFPQDLSCFQLETDAFIDENKVGVDEVLIRVRYVSIDPVLRVWISGAKSYIDARKPGSPIPGFGIGQVFKVQNNQGLQVGDWVVGMFSWSQYILIHSQNAQKIPLQIQNMYKFLTVMGPTGFTAFVSIKKEIQPFTILDPKTKQIKTKEKLNILISSVAGGVGLSLVEYLLKMGYRNIYGIAGTDEKCKMAKKIGCKGAINYKKYENSNRFESELFEGDLMKMMEGEGADIYYDNIGEQMLSSALNVMANHSKVILCGATPTYNSWKEKQGLINYEQIILKRIQMRGILYFDMKGKERAKQAYDMFLMDAQGFDNVLHGIQLLPQAYRDTMHGKYIGKVVVDLQQ